jgi:hypothetical protein
MNTDAGRAEALRRVEFVRAYRDQLLHEITMERAAPSCADD